MSSNLHKFLEIYVSLKRELGLISSPQLKKTKIGRNQMMVMATLDHQGPLSSSSLSDYTQSDPASTTRTVQALEKLGWIKRVTDKKDQRKSLIELTTKGRKHTEKIHKITADIGHKIDETLTSTEHAQVIQLLTKIVKSLQNRRSKEAFL